MQSAHNEALSLKLQDQLIKEEEEAERLSDERQASRLAIEREKKARKKVLNLWRPFFYLFLDSYPSSPSYLNPKHNTTKSVQWNVHLH